MTRGKIDGSLSERKDEARLNLEFETVAEKVPNFETRAEEYTYRGTHFFSGSFTLEYKRSSSPRFWKEGDSE